MNAYGGRALTELRAVSHAGRPLARATIVGACFVVAYAVATVAGAPPALLSQVFNLPMAVALVVAWWALVVAPAEIRALWLLLALAATSWGVGSVGWIVEFERNGERVPTPPTVWDIAFALALALTVVAVALAIRGSIVLRHAVLDAVVILAAAIAIGAVFAERSAVYGLSWRTGAALDRPFLGLLTLVLIGSAALGSSTGLRRSTALLGLGQVFLVAGHLIYSLQSLSGGRVDDRWCDLAWATGAVVSSLGGICVVSRDDPLLRFGRPLPDSPHPRGSHAALAAGCAAAAASLGVVFYGIGTDSKTATAFGAAAALVAVGGLALRGRGAMRSADAAYVTNDRLLLRSELQRDELKASNAALMDANLRMRLYQESLRTILSEVDERSDGGLRDLVSDTTGLELDELDDDA